MNKINLKNDKKLNKLFIFFFFITTILISLNFEYQKMPLTSSMTFNSPVYLNADEIKIYVNAKTSYTYNSYKEINQSEINKTSNQYKPLKSSILFIVLACGIPLIILIIVLFVPSKKITDSFIAYDLKKKGKKQKLKLGIQKQKKSSYFEIDDDNL